MAATANSTLQPANSPTPAAVQGQPAAGQAIIPFARAAQRHVEQGVTQNVASASWASGLTQQFLVPSYGYLRALFLTVTGSGGVNGTKTVAAYEDAPWNLFSSVLFTDSNGAPIISLDGYALHLARKFGGYKPWREDQSAFGYSGISTGASGTGNFKAKFEIYQIFGRDGLGALANMDASAAYRLNLTYNGPNTFYAGASGTPGTPPSLAALLEAQCYARPAPTNSKGQPQATQPPAAGTIQYWTSQTFNLNAGQNTLQLTRVGNVVRNHILVFRSATDGTRATAETDGTVPSVIEFDYDAGIRYKMNVDTSRQLTYENFGYDVENGVIVFNNTNDPDEEPFAEYGDEYLETLGSTKLQLQFVNSHAGTLQVITNDIVPASGAIYAAPAMQILGG
jgi:hypothetical protein